MAIKGEQVVGLVQMDSLHIQHFALSYANREGAKQKVTSVGYPYGTSEEGEKIFSPEQLRWDTDDMQAEVVKMAIDSGIAPEDVPAAIDAARASVQGMDPLTAFAAFEYAMGILYKHFGLFNFTGTE